MPCVICGSPDTVEAHLIPRGLVRRLAGAEEHALRGDTVRAGYRYDGKGIFDRDLLCVVHEDRFRLSDDYGQRFLDLFHKDRSAPQARSRSLPNRKPELLVRFVASCIWRCAISRIPCSPPLDLGPWEHQLRLFLFDDRPGWSPLLLLARQLLSIDGVPMSGPLLVLPFKAPGLGRRTYGFQFGTCIMMLILDDRHERRAFQGFSAGHRDPAPVVELASFDWQSQPWSDMEGKGHGWSIIKSRN